MSRFTLNVAFGRLHFRGQTVNQIWIIWRRWWHEWRLYWSIGYNYRRIGRRQKPNLNFGPRQPQKHQDKTRKAYHTSESSPASKAIVPIYHKPSEYLKMKWKGRKLMNTDSWFDFWDKSDPYLKFIKIRSDNSFIEVART